MTDKEKTMYQIMGIISESDAPIVFKGAMVTKLVLAESGFTAFSRETKDVDANWVGDPPSMESLGATINAALERSGNSFMATAFREHGDKRSAGFAFKDAETGEEIFIMDISIKPVVGSRVYRYGDMQIRGVLPNEILADKITVMSTKSIFRRAKDIVDVYALSHCVRVDTSEIFEVFRKNSEREVGAFTEFLVRRADIQHAYNKLTGVEGKPPFDDVYVHLSKFLHPFIERDEAPKLWNIDTLTWDVPFRAVISEEKPSVMDEICSARKGRSDTPSYCTSKTKRKNGKRQIRPHVRERAYLTLTIL